METDACMSDYATKMKGKTDGRKDEMKEKMQKYN